MSFGWEIFCVIYMTFKLCGMEMQHPQNEQLISLLKWAQGNGLDFLKDGIYPSLIEWVFC